jgi:hypothetical protein
MQMERAQRTSRLHFKRDISQLAVTALWRKPRRAGMHEEHRPFPSAHPCATPLSQLAEQ